LDNIMYQTAPNTQEAAAATNTDKNPMVPPSYRMGESCIRNAFFG
jgi:hypothetical protein